MRKKKKSRKKETDPWKSVGKKEKKQDENSFFYFVKHVFGTIGQRATRSFEDFGKHKIHVRYLRKAKRVVFAGLFFLYFMLTLVSTGNLFFFLLFLATAYLALDYLWKTRRVVWAKKSE